jgi:hypothetical protein
MDLSRAVDKVELTLKDVESDEADGALVELAVHPLVHALHEAYVRIPEERIAGPIAPGTLIAGDADETVEVGDLGRLVAGSWAGRSQWSVRGAGKIMVDERPAERVPEPTGNGQRRDTQEAAVLQEFQGQLVPGRLLAARAPRPDPWGSPARPNR